MARIRSIKPEFWTDEKLSECSVSARLLFIGLWSFSDDDGRMEYQPTRIRMQIFPCGSVAQKHLMELLSELRERSLIRNYVIAGKEYLDIPNFAKHQKINRPTPSRLPEYSLSPHVTLSESSPLEGKGKGEGVTRLNGASAKVPRDDGGKRGSRIPEDFQLTEDRKAYAVKCGIDPERAFAKFANHWRAKTGRDATKLDWDATWQTWCMNEQDWKKPGAKPVTDAAGFRW